MSQDLVPTITRWMNDFDGVKTLGPCAPRPVMVETELHWVGLDRIDRVIG